MHRSSVPAHSGRFMHVGSHCSCLAVPWTPCPTSDRSAQSNVRQVVYAVSPFWHPVGARSPGSRLREAGIPGC